MIHEILSRLPIFEWHSRSHSAQRADRLAQAVAELAPPSKSMLDIGSSDGLLARGIAGRIGVEEVRGVDVKLQPNALVEVVEYDGRVLPFSDARFDLVTICDVLHHASDPLKVVREAMRVLRPNGALIIKDHFRWSHWSNGVLLAMDVFGNYKAGVFVRGNYLTPPKWIDLVARAGATIDRLLWPLQIHDLPIRFIARSEYQFAMRVRHPRHDV